MAPGSNTIIAFKIGILGADQIALWQQGGAELLDLSASSPMAPPHIFIGKATLNGSNAPAGTVVSARIDGILRGAVEVGSNGSYGPLLVRPGLGTTIVFRIGDFIADQIATWQQGGANALDLTAVNAAAFTVNSTIDNVDLSPGDGLCADANGKCTLRAAVMEANALPGPNTIIVPAGTYILTIPGTGDDSALSGDLDITDDLTINGSGQKTPLLMVAASTFCAPMVTYFIAHDSLDSTDPTKPDTPDTPDTSDD